MPRASRPCSRPACPAIATFRGMCPTHAREYEAARGTPAQRGYGYHFRKASDEAKRNATHCAQCGQPFTPANPATGGHTKAVRHGGSTSDGIEAQCRRCNYGWKRTGL